MAARKPAAPKASSTAMGKANANAAFKRGLSQPAKPARPERPTKPVMPYQAKRGKR